ncbi:leucine-rich repeat domain-containing protein [Companilactobacillus sp. HBUAS59699]|uniref:leucine-rich repeat domain-containing protein n=1 Tax=Companilactobacillus sp. HBUAS59699 TaxID=3109358 RepID=UPI002FEF7F02
MKSKNKIILIASSLSVGVLLTSTVSNIPEVAKVVAHENVVRAEGETESIDSWMPDPELQKIIAGKLGLDNVGDITKTKLSEFNNWADTDLEISGEKIQSLEGIQYASNLEGLALLGTSVSDISPVKGLKNLKSLFITNNAITNFQPLQNLNLDKDEVYIGNGELVTIKNKIENLSEEQLVIDLSDYIGNYEGLSVNNLTIYNGENEISTDMYAFNDKTKQLIINDWISEGKVSNNGVYQGSLTISFKQQFTIPWYLGNLFNQSIVIEQPYKIGNNNIGIIDSKTVMTDKDQLTIYDKNGNVTGSKNLSGITIYNVTKVNKINNEEYYQIGDDEWISTKDVSEFHRNETVIQTHHDTYTTLSTLSGNTIGNRALAANSNWYSNGYAFINGEKYHRISTNEWIHDDHGVVYEKISGIVVAKENVQLYNSKGKKSNRALMNGAEFYTDKVGKINGQDMYRVASDEWVPAELVTLK